MKKVALILCLMTMSFIAQSQISVSTVKKETIFKTAMSLHQLTKFTDDSTSYYGFYFRDAQYTQIVEYKYFTMSDTSEVREFFNLVTSVIESGESMHVTVGTADLYITAANKSAATIYLGRGYFYFSKKQIVTLLSTLK